MRKEREKNNFTFLIGYFVLILHFDPDSYREKISTFMRVLKSKLRTNSFSQESKFIYFAFLNIFLMRKTFFITTLLIYSVNIFSQTTVNQDFDEMLQLLLSNSVPQITVDELEQMDGVCLLDARELEEYKVSHIEGAQHIGYDNLNEKILENIPKEQTIVLYCSVGYRSEKVGEQLQKMGYTNVYNLYGSIFEWVNQGNRVVDENGTTTRVHTYNKRWSKWLENGTPIY